MTRVDTETRQTTGIVLAVGLFAAGDSYSHIFSLARAHHQDVISAALLPLAGDGLVIAASRVMLIAASRGLDVPFRARLTFWAGVAATIAANWAYGYQHGHSSALLSVWATACYLGATEMLTWMHAHLRPHPKKVNAFRRASSDPVPDAPNDPDPDASEDELADESPRQRAPRRPLEELLALAEAKFAGVRTGAEIPVLRTIQAELGIGQANAQTVQAHLKAIWAQDSVASLLPACM